VNESRAIFGKDVDPRENGEISSDGETERDRETGLSGGDKAGGEETRGGECTDEEIEETESEGRETGSEETWDEDSRHKETAGKRS
jgi:hypothetical protein